MPKTHWLLCNMTSFKDKNNNSTSFGNMKLNNFFFSLIKDNNVKFVF